MHQSCQGHCCLLQWTGLCQGSLVYLSRECARGQAPSFCKEPGWPEQLQHRLPLHSSLGVWGIGMVSSDPSSFYPIVCNTASLHSSRPGAVELGELLPTRPDCFTLWEVVQQMEQKRPVRPDRSTLGSMSKFLHRVLHHMQGYTRVFFCKHREELLLQRLQRACPLPFLLPSGQLFSST